MPPIRFAGSSVTPSQPAAPDVLYETFAAGMRTAYCKLLVNEIPRMLRPPKKHGTAATFRPGAAICCRSGSWATPMPTPTPKTRPRGSPRVLINATRHGDEAFALRLLDHSLARFTDASPLERAKVML